MHCVIVLNVLGKRDLAAVGRAHGAHGPERAPSATSRGIAAGLNCSTAFAGGLGITGLLQSSTATALLVASLQAAA